MELFKLFGSIMVDSDAAENSISKTGDKADGMGKKLGKGIATAAKFGAALVVGAAAGIGGMLALGIKIGNTADTILDLNSITGMSTDSVQEWRKVAEVAGIGADSMTNASMKLTKSLDIMSTGTGKGAESLEKLGFSFKDIEGMSADERMNALTEALAGVDDKTERARIGTDLFGGSWKEIAPAVDLGAEAMQKAKDSANIISNEDLVKANNFRITVENMKDQLGFFVTEITIMLLPALQVMMGWFNEKLPTIKTLLKTAFDAGSQAIRVIGDVFQNEVLPRIQEFWNWLEPKLPALKLGFENAFSGAVTAIKGVIDTIQEASKWVKDHWAILEPILLGVAGGAIAFYAITGALAVYNAAILFASGVGPIYTAVTTAMTAVTGAFGAVLAFVTSPIFLVVLAIGALIAIGVLLYKNWDTVVAKTKQLGSFLAAKFTEIKTVVVAKVTELATAAVNKFNELKDKAKAKVIELALAVISKFVEIKTGISNKVNEIKTAVVNKFTELKTAASNKVTELKTAVTGKFGEILSSAKSKFDAVKSAIMNPIETAKSAVKKAIDTIKGYFSNMKLNLPKIKVPSFKLKNWSMNPLDWVKNMPSIGINWNAKGALFTKPTVFNTPMGLQGFGEAGPEAALPLNSSVLGMIGQKISETMEQKNTSQYDGRPIIFQTFLNGRIIAEEIHSDMNELMGSRTNLDFSMKGG